MRTKVIPSPIGSQTKNLSGLVFEKLSVLSFAGYYHAREQRYACFKCLCECGAEKVIRGSDLTSGRVKSCGCHNSRQASRRFRKHGKPPEYVVWAGMVQRCTNPKSIGYANYGGRGIAVCDRWRNSFEAFLSDMGKRPSVTHTIDRRDSNGNYEPANCRWATRGEQAVNTRRNRFVTYRGETLTVSGWARRLGVIPQLLHFRLNAGWTAEEIIETKPKIGNRWRQK